MSVTNPLGPAPGGFSASPVEIRPGQPSLSRGGMKPSHPGRHAPLDRLFGLVRQQFVDKGVPVVVGEFGAMRRDTLTGDAAPEAAILAELTGKLEQCHELFDGHRGGTNECSQRARSQFGM
jgi:hypothetical protein